MNAEIRTLETRIDRVTVYRNGALVVRRATLTHDGAASVVLRVPGLPLLFQSETLRIRVGSPGFSAGPVEEEDELGGEPERRSPLAEQHDRRKEQLLALRELDEVHSRLLAACERLTVAPELDPSRRAEPSWPSLESWTALTDISTQKIDQLREERQRLRQRIRAVEEQLAQQQAALNAEDPSGAKVTRCARTTLRREAEGAGPESIDIEVEYFVAGARWAPSYTLELRADGAARLSLLAWVGQATGEDWSGAAVAVSTSDLRRTTALPRLPAWKIGRAASPPPSGWRPLPEDLDGLFADADAAGSPRPSWPAPSPKPPTETSAEPPELDDSGDDVITGVREAPKKARRANSPPSPPGAPPTFAGPPPPQSRQAPAPRAAPVGGAMPSAPPPAPMELAPPRAKSSGLFRSRAADMEGAGAAEMSMSMSMDYEQSAAFAPPPPPPPLEPGRLLNYAWLRLPRWDERGKRGRLWPVDALADLRAIAEERGDSARVQQVERAVADQRAAMRRLERAPLPPGCTPVEGSTFQFRYPFSGRVTVPADGRFVQVPVASGETAWQTLYRAVPRQSAQAFRTVKLDNPLSAPLPAGPVRVSDRGDVRAAGQLGPLGSGGRIALDLGVEEGLRIARNATYAEAEKGMISAVSVGTNTVRTEIISRLDHPATLQIWERLPLAPEGGDLSVALESSSQEPTRDLGPDNEKQEGALRWELKIAAGARAELRYTYTVRLPARLEVVGGARREP